MSFLLKSAQNIFEPPLFDIEPRFGQFELNIHHLANSVPNVFEHFQCKIDAEKNAQIKSESFATNSLMPIQSANFSVGLTATLAKVQCQWKMCKNQLTLCLSLVEILFRINYSGVHWMAMNSANNYSCNGVQACINPHICFAIVCKVCNSVHAWPGCSRCSARKELFCIPWLMASTSTMQCMNTPQLEYKLTKAKMSNIKSADVCFSSDRSTLRHAVPLVWDFHFTPIISGEGDFE